MSVIVDLVLPTAEQELWRYSRIGELDLGAYAVGAADTTVSGDQSIISRDMRLTLDDVSAEPADVFEQLHARHTSSDERHTPGGSAHGSTVRIGTSRGQTIADPILITHNVRDSSVVCFPSLEIDAGENSEVTVVERFVSDDECRSLVVPMVKIRAAQSARVTYVAINELGMNTWLIGYQRALGERDSTVSTSTIALGGDYARTRAGVRLVGQGASAKQVALYFADGTQMHDFRTLQDHAAPRTHSDLLFKGAVKDHAKSVYTGLIKIRDNADKSEAFQTNRNLTLSSGSWAESVPNLEIETNDVKCSHASTVGPVDDDQRFYLESRGIRPEIAERLVVFGFFADVINRLPAAAQPDVLREKVGRKLLGDATRGATTGSGVRA
ncbi:MAG: Fe-S cluster assembly protein SufD [Ilumatobacteraceae bacterium]